MGKPSQPQDQRPKGVYILPNLATTSALLAGFYAIIAAIQGQFMAAGIAVFVAQVLDTLDGRIARMTNTQSAFGEQYDSLSDCISFGVAPAILAYQFSLIHLDKVGWVAAFVYVAAGALRLARFNTQISSTDKRFFIGLASPAAAAIIAGSIWSFSVYGINGKDYSVLFAIVVAGLGLMMVSNIRFYSFKVVSSNGKLPFVILPLTLSFFALLIIEPHLTLTLMAVTYALSGIVFEVYLQLRKWFKHKKRQKN